MTNVDEAKARLAKDREARDAQTRLVAGEVKPTPTQEENDLAALGVPLTEHEPDGSPPQPPPGAEAQKGAPSPGYQTRQSTAAPAASHGRSDHTRSRQTE